MKTQELSTKKMGKKMPPQVTRTVIMSEKKMHELKKSINEKMRFFEIEAVEKEHNSWIEASKVRI